MCHFDKIIKKPKLVDISNSFCEYIILTLEDKLYKISSLVGKPVVSIFEGHMVGYVKNVLFDEKLKKINYFEFFDEEENEYLVTSKDIYAIDDAIVVKNCNCIMPKDTVDLKEKSPVNFLVFLTNGKKIGKICDVEVDKKLKTLCFEIDNKTELSTNQILNIGKDIAILKTNNMTKLANYKPKNKIITQKIATDNIVTIQNKITTPKKLLTDNYRFLIGRKLDKNIYAQNNQLIAKKQTLITSNIIDIASKNGKLKELTNSSIEKAPK